MFERPHSKNYLFDELDTGAMKQVMGIHYICTGTYPAAIQYSA